MKKLVALLLALMMFAPTALAHDEVTGWYTPPKMNEGQYPIKEEGVKLTYWMQIAGNAVTFISSYQENPVYQAAEKATGIDIEFIHPAAGTDRESFSLLMGQELPDIIQLPNTNYYTGGLQAMYDDGIIIDLAPYLEEYAPQYHEIINAGDLIKTMSYIDGHVLGFRKITNADAMPYHRINVNKDWLDEMGVAEPKTIAEYEAYFDWVLANKPGVTPLYMGSISGSSSETMNLFTGAFDFLYDWYIIKDSDNKVGHWANAEGLKDFVTLLNNWYVKGYLGKDFIAQTQSEAQALFDAGKLAAICDSVDATYTRVRNLENGKFTVTNLPYMRKEADSVLGSNLATHPFGETYVAVVTTACKNPEAAVQFLNYGYTFEGSLPYSFGIEGEHWYWGEDGVPKFTELITANPNGMTISNTSYCLKAHFATRYCYPDAIAHPSVASNTEALRIRTMWASDTNEQNWLRLPPIALTAEEDLERSALIAQVDTYAKEMLIKFVTGAEPLDNFDAYVKAVEEYGLLEAIEITQGAVDRFYGIAD